MGKTLNTKTIYERSSDLMVADMDGEMVMMDVEQGSYFAINQVGAHLWTQLETPQSVQALMQSVLETFATDDAAQVQTDVDRFLNDLATHNLIRESSA